MPDTDQHVLIIGAGIIGLSVGRELARAGGRVELFDRDAAGEGASHVATGMLAPDAELEFEETHLHAFNTESRRRWPDFASDLEADTGVVAATGHYRHGVLLTPITAQEIARYVLTGTRSDWIAPFRPDRFETVSLDRSQQ